MEEIFVAILCLFAFGVGIWTWWYENYSPVEKDDNESACTEDVHND